MDYGLTKLTLFINLPTTDADHHEMLVMLILFSQDMIKENAFFFQLKCCGVQDYQDFYTDSVWDRNRTVTVASMNVTVQLVAPYACCKMDDDKSPIQPETCATAPTDLTSNWKTVSVIRVTNSMKLVIPFHFIS